MRRVQLLVTMFFALIVVFSWCALDAQAGAAPPVAPSGYDRERASFSNRQGLLVEGRTARIERNLDKSQPVPKHVASTLIFPSRSTILAVVCTGLGLAVTTALIVSSTQRLTKKSVRYRRIRPELRRKTWAELTQSPQF
jgi:hypothetical protein